MGFSFESSVCLKCVCELEMCGLGVQGNELRFDIPGFEFGVSVGFRIHGFRFEVRHLSLVYVGVSTCAWYL